MDGGRQNCLEPAPWRHDVLASDLARWLRKEGRFLAFLNLEMADCEGAPKREPRPPHPGYGLRDEEWRTAYDEWRAADQAWRASNPRGGRPDVFAVANTSNAARMVTRVYEVKVERGDFLSDVRTGKWRRYLYMAGTIVFAAPAGVVAAADVPEGCGLLLRHPQHWERAKNPRAFHRGRLSFAQAFRTMRACHSQLAGDHWRRGAAV